jgi:hypothetical protein
MPRPRLHKSSFVVGLIVALLLVIIAFPGRIVSGIGGTNVSKVFEHGWPWIYLRRETAERYAPPSVTTMEELSLVLSFSPVAYTLDIRSDLPGWGIPWLSAENWRFWESDTKAVPPRWVLNPAALCCNIAIALVLLAGIVAAWEFRRRRRMRPFSFGFSLRGLLLAVGAIGVMLGWLTHLKREHRREAALIEHVFESTGPMEGTWFDVDHVCAAPDWLRSLIGVQIFPSYFWRASAVEIQTDRGQNFDYFCGQISQLQYVTKIVLEGDARHRIHFSALRHLERVETLEIWTYRTIDAQDVEELAQLKQLEKIVIENINEIPPDVRTRLKTELPNCTIIDYLDDW